MKFVLFVEGHTEALTVPRFLKLWLDPRLSEPVGIQAVRFAGWSELVKKLPKKARMHLEGPDKERIIAAAGLLDLYGPSFYPAHMVEAAERCAWGIQHFTDQVGHPKFRMFFAVHELEAWLLSQPAILAPKVAAALPGKTRNPEEVNFHEPPSALLRRLYREQLGQAYKKTSYGSALFAKANPDIAYERCPNLRRMFDEMLSLARSAGL